ncbi:hypothetical protein [Xanthomonas oryzae]
MSGHELELDRLRKVGRAIKRFVALRTELWIVIVLCLWLLMLYKVVWVPYEREKAEFYRAVYAQSDNEKNFNEYIEKTAAAAPQGVAATVANAWVHCAVGEKSAVGLVEGIVPRTEEELDACEVTSVQLAVSRGFDQAEASRYVQNLRSDYENARRKHYR